jgi:hypothetical protein
MNSYEAQKVIIKLNRDTKEGKIKWEVSHHVPSSVGGTERLIDNVYITSVSKKKMRLYKLESKFYYDEGLSEWSESYRLEFIDFNNKTEWEFPKDSSILDLYDTVRYKTSNVEDFFKDFLTEE